MYVLADSIAGQRFCRSQNGREKQRKWRIGWGGFAVTTADAEPHVNPRQNDARVGNKDHR